MCLDKQTQNHTFPFFHYHPIPMAPFSNFISFLFITSLLFSLQINARDSQFFSKVTPLNPNNKETKVPYNEEPMNKAEQQQQPVFIPETSENSYGLYGHESGLNPPSTTSIKAATTTYQPSYKTEAEDNNKYFYYNKNKDAYGDTQNAFSDTKYTEGGFDSMENKKNQKYYYNNHNNNNNGESDKYFYNNNNNNNNGDSDKYFYDNNNGESNKYFYNNNNGASDKYFYNNKYKNDERQGISDTRFIEGGKYFYDVNSGKHNPTLYGGSGRGVNSDNNWVNNRGYFGANKNSMGGYQSQEEVFEDDQENFEP